MAAAALAALLAFVAVPAALILVVGNPLSGGLGHTWSWVPRLALCVLALAAWIAWAACCAQLIAAVAGRVRRADVRTGTSASLVDQLAARIAIGVLALMGLVGPAASAGAVPAAPAPGPTSVTTTTPLRPGDMARREVAAGTTCVVQQGDTLWTVADTCFDDGADWTSIARSNLGRNMPDGGRFVDPDHLRSGWRLSLPAGARTPPRGPGGHTEREGGHLPELLALGMGSLGCAAFARRAARRRSLRPFTGDGPGPELTDAALDAAALVGRFGDVPVLDAFEIANAMLGRALRSRSPAPTVRALHVGPSGVTFHLRTPDPDAPDGFMALGDGAAWRIGHDEIDAGRAAGPAPPAVPLALPVGDDEDGTWLVVLYPGTVLPLLGESALALWRAARAALESWAWSDTILVGDDPADEALHAEAAADPAVARHLVFVGDPAALPRGVARRAAVVTTSAVAASDLTVLVDRHGATLHPMSRVVRPYLQTVETARALSELVSGADATYPEGIPASPEQVGVVPAPGASDAGFVPGASDAGLVPGPVDVRLLTTTPRLEGLRGELPPNRARRAVELVAYLVLHQPDVVTGDRLRTRVLGSSDADAAAKTLFNTAHAARRAMGVDEQGDLLFPSGTRTGMYQVSPRVTVDVHRAAALAADGARQAETDPELAMTRLRGALELVEGEPLANALSGYSWWEAEGHGARVAALLVEAACSLAALAAGHGRFDLARWALDRARLVAPFSEALSRAAMRTAAAEGDADRLRLEWHACQQLVDSLDPGSSPSRPTEALYGELCRTMSGRSPQRYSSPASDSSPASAP